jgi:hypothetical protein
VLPGAVAGPGGALALGLVIVGGSALLVSAATLWLGGGCIAYLLKGQYDVLNVLLAPLAVAFVLSVWLLNMTYKIVLQLRGRPAGRLIPRFIALPVCLGFGLLSAAMVAMSLVAGKGIPLGITGGTVLFLGYGVALIRSARV